MSDDISILFNWVVDIVSAITGAVLIWVVPYVMRRRNECTEQELKKKNRPLEVAGWLMFSLGIVRGGFLFIYTSH